jgi:hypothetical protein
MKKHKRKMFERISVERKIIESLRLKLSINSLVRSLGKGKGYVIKVRDLGVTHGYLEFHSDQNKRILLPTAKDLPPYPEAIFPFDDKRELKSSEAEEVFNSQLQWIKDCLEAEWTPQTIYEELKNPIPRSNFYRFLTKHKLKSQRLPTNVLEIIHEPGECLQLDWGKLFDVIDPKTQKKKTVWIFIGTLGHSRYEMARVVERLDYKTTINALMSMFAEMGGVPKKLIIDNPKVFVIEASKYEPILNPAFERFAGHYGVMIEALPPYTPELKGKVERKVSGKRRLFESYDIKKYELETAQSHINKKLLMINERKHGTHRLRPLDVFLDDEARLLKALPVLSYELEHIEYTTVRKDGYVRFENKYYRISPALNGKSALLIGNTVQVSIYCEGKLLEVYEKITNNFVTKACKEHYRESWEKTLKDHGHYLKQARKIGPFVEQFVSIILARGGGFIDTRVVWGLLSLDKKYDVIAIDNACKDAIEFEEINLATVKKFLNMNPRETRTELNNDGQQMLGGKFVRPMSEYTKHLKLVQ